MPLGDHFAPRAYAEDWGGDCHRRDVSAREDALDDVCSTLSDYLRERYIARTELEDTIEARLHEHGIPIDLKELLPSTPRSQNGAFGEALCLLGCREYGLLAPLDKLGGEGNPNPDIPKPGIDVLAFSLAEQEGEQDEIYVFEVKTLSTTASVRASVRGSKGIIRFFNAKVSGRPAFFHQEVNAVVRALDSKGETKRLAVRVLALGRMPLAKRLSCSHYCAVFVLDDRLDVDRYLHELTAINHPPSRKWLRVLWFPGLRRVVRRTIEGAALRPGPGG